MGNPVASALAGAKTALANANNSSVGTKSGHSGFSTGHEYSNAPYHLAHSVSKPAAPKSGISGEASDAGEGIKSRMENEDAARKTLIQ